MSDPKNPVPPAPSFPPAVDRLDDERRRFLRHAAHTALGTAALAGLPQMVRAQAPAVVTAQRLRPQVPGGVMSGDVSGDAAMLWSRTDRNARMLVEYAFDERFSDPVRIAGPVALARDDYTARVDLRGLPAGRRVYYRVRFQDMVHASALSEPLTGSLMLPDRAGEGGLRDVSFAFSGDEAGQGWGINEAWGGYRVYESMRRMLPDFFIHSGDQIYADGPLQDEVRLDDGSIWRNVVTEAKSKVAQTLDDYRGNFAYNMLDTSKRRFCAEVPFLVQWDDHEVRNNWYPGQIIGAADKRYEERRLDMLAQHARQAMFEHNPFRIDQSDPWRIYRAFHHGPLLDVFMLDQRSYRGANSPNRQRGGAAADFLGPAQMRWLKQALLRSKATWKVIASDMPLSIVVPDLNPDVPRGWCEAWANNEHGAPSGRELEVADLLRFIKRHDIRNVVWVSADVHYCSATHYAPERASAGFIDFKPFWEFVGGPINAGTFGPGEIDRTFGPEVRFVGIPPDMKQNRSPADLFQFFGFCRINAETRVLTVSLHNADGHAIWSVELPPET